MQQAPPISAVAMRVAKLPLLARRRVLRALFHVSNTVQGRAAAGLATHFERVLRLPRREALRLDREAVYHDRLAELEWLSLLTRNRAAIERDLDHVTTDTPQLLSRIASGGEPVILAPLHMGPYVLGLLHTMLTFFPDRPLLILRRRDDRPAETQVMERIAEFGTPVRFLTVTDRAGFLPAIRFAKGGAVIVVFADLPPHYGKPAAMPIFGLPTRFAFGIDAMAYLTGATVVPIAIGAEAGRDVVAPRPPFTVHGNDAEERDRAAELMRRHIEATILERPEQWHFWPSLHEYVQPDAPATPRGLAA
ncbi:hypothetical protein [Methylobacterium sp. WL8]|uniref:LpxL/LpxP family acyltransferase n=1 Tax=Methylobacterium sp. WL8 TaxID=2603899 RepID=UPI0011CB8261|nr:hypothetical protein [Methylobacterium sp. WL8]TXN77009.1 hypothetical protein FV234_24165 [Methylobacterium sp. WL8]